MRRMAWSARRAALLDPSAVDVNRKTSSTTQAQKPCSILPHSRILPPSGRGSKGSVIMAAPAPGKAKAAHEHSSAEASGLHAANLSALVLPESSTNFGDMQPLPSWRQHIARDSRVIYRGQEGRTRASPPLPLLLHTANRAREEFWVRTLEDGRSPSEDDTWSLVSWRWRLC